jgi:protein-disulfide isomerase
MLSLTACSQASATGELDRKQIETIVQEYLMENPEIIRDAMIALADKEEREAMAAVKDEIYNDKRDVVLGPKKAKVTIVEFFDYNCGYCKKSTDWLMEAMDENPKDLRVSRNFLCSMDALELPATPRLPRLPRQNKTNMLRCMLP